PRRGRAGRAHGAPLSTRGLRTGGTGLVQRRLHVAEMRRAGIGPHVETLRRAARGHAVTGWARRASRLDRGLRHQDSLSVRRRRPFGSRFCPANRIEARAVLTMNDPPRVRRHFMRTTNSLRTRVLARAAAVLAAAVPIGVIGASAAVATVPNVGFGFNARDIKGAPTGAVRLTGGGSF